MTEESLLIFASGAFLAFVFVYYICTVIAGWKMFQKFGEPAWKSLIPVYNLYIIYKYVWNTQVFWIYLLCMIVSAFTNGVDNMICYALTIVSGIVVIVVQIMIAGKKAKAFGKGTLFAIGLFFFEPIFNIILGFGSAKYIGNAE